MPHSIFCSTKIFTLAILVGVIYEFVMVPGAYILMSSQRKMYTIFPESTYIHIQQHIH